MKRENLTALERTQEIFDFLQGSLPEGTIVPRREIPNLSRDRAWTVIWFLQNLYWQIPDRIERCEVCGDLYDSWSEGDTLDYGNVPYSFCSNCVDGEKYVKKMRRNPDKEMRAAYFRR